MCFSSVLLYLDCLYLVEGEPPLPAVTSLLHTPLSDTCDTPLAVSKPEYEVQFD